MQGRCSPFRKERRIKFSEIAKRLTGISTPFGGASWQPAEMKVAAARRVIAVLDGRRVLYEPSQMEVPSHCVHSVIEIRHHLSGALGKLHSACELSGSLQAMQVACRKFIERVGTDGEQVIHFANEHSHYASWIFYNALGELRGTVGVHVVKIASRFNLDVGDRLVSILPANAEANSGDDDRLFRRLHL